MPATDEPPEQQATPEYTGPRYIAEVIGDHFNEQGIRIQERDITVVDETVMDVIDGEEVPRTVERQLGELPEDFPRFLGFAKLGLNTPMGPMERMIQFGIEADSIEEAFANYQEAVSAAAPGASQRIIEELMQMAQQAQGPRIATPPPGFDPSKVPMPNQSKGGIVMP